MNKLRKLLGVLLAASMSAVLAACAVQPAAPAPAGGTEAAAPQEAAAEEEAGSTLDEVTLKFVFIGEPAPETDDAFVELNKLMKEKINATIEPTFLSWADWDQKYPLLFSSGEDFDMIYTADWAFYSEVASKGGFYPLTMDMINEYCPLCVENLPEIAWTSSAMNGTIYMIPQNNYFANHYGLIIRGDLRKKYGMDEITNLDQLEAFMQNVLDNEEGMIPLDISSDNAEMYMRLFVVYEDEHWYLAGEHTGVLTYAFTDPEVLQLDAFYDLPGYEDYLVRVANWNKNGYISKSDLTSTNEERFEAGKSAVTFGNINDALTQWQQAKANHPEWEVEYVNLLADKKLGSVGYSQGTAFNAKTKNIERAMMAADLLSYDPDINFIINNGIPGVHAAIRDTVEYEGHVLQEVEMLKPGAYGDYSYWNFSNTPTVPTESFDGFTDIMLSYFYKQDAHHPLDGFVFDTSKVSTEIALTNDLLSEYLPILYLGFTDDPLATLAEFKQKLEAAGIDAVNEEMTRQAKERMGITE